MQALLGGEPYKRLRAYGPDGREILDLRPKGSLQMQGMSDFFFESAEPSLDEFSMAEFLERFPEGIYEFETTTVEGVEQDGETMFTHVIPAGPKITSPSEGDVVDPENLVIAWEPVKWTTKFNPPKQPCGYAHVCRIIGYQVIVTKEDPLRIYSVDVPPEINRISVPPEFLDPGTEYELEILAIEESDNQTISIVFFETRD